MSDRLLTLAWRVTEHVVMRDHTGGQAVPQGCDVAPGDAYVWRQGRSDVTLRRDGDVWSVSCTTVGRLLGPPKVLHSAQYRRADLAIWDVMARVIRFTRDEELGLRAGSDAAAWIRGTGITDEGEDRLLH